MNRPGRFRRPLAALALLIALGCSAGIAQPIRGAEPIRVSSSSAKADFPKGMTFHLDADGDSTITRVELLFTKASLETLHLVTPKFTPARRIAIDATSDFQIDFVPPGIDVSYHWRLTDVDGRTTETPPLSVLWEDTRFDWKSISTPQVTVYAYNGNDAFNQIVLDSSQKTIDRLQDEFGVKKSLPIRIWVYNSKKDFSGSQAPNSQDWIAGTAYPDMQVVLAVLPEGDKHEVGRIIPHETSHQMLNQATKNPFNSPPTWLDEGLAVSNQDNGNEDFPAIVGRASAENRLLSIRALTSEFPYDPAQATLAYAESFSVVQFLRSRYGETAIASIIAAYRLGMSHDDVLRKAIGVDVDGLDKAWRETLARSSRSAPVGGVSGAGPLSSLLSGGTLIAAATLLALGVARVRRLRGRPLQDDDQTLLGERRILPE